MGLFSFCSPGSVESAKTRGFEFLPESPSLGSVEPVETRGIVVLPETPSSPCSTTTSQLSDYEDQHELTQEEGTEIVLGDNISSPCTAEVPQTESSLCVSPKAVKAPEIAITVVGIVLSAVVSMSMRQ